MIHTGITRNRTVFRLRELTQSAILWSHMLTPQMTDRFRAQFQRAA